MRPITPLLLMLSIVAATDAAGAPDKLRPVAPDAFPDLFVRADTCNVYVLRDGDAALLIDLGDGSVLDHLHEIGVKRVEWVLFTGHHRELCQGHPRLKASAAGAGAKAAAPEAERALFEDPASFRRMKPSLADPFTVHGASYVRPPVRPVPLDRGFTRVDTFTWRGREISCVETHGGSPGGMSYLLRHGDRLYAFSGDVMLDGARMHNWFDAEWDYGFGAGAYAVQEAAGILQAAEPDLLLPAHGPPVDDPAAQLADYQEKLRRAVRLMLRTYSVVPYVPRDQDRVSQPTDVPNVRRVSPHLFKFRGANYVPNFSLIVSDTGRGLVVDCGRVGASLLDQSLELMRRRHGLKGVDAVVVTHMHGDHFTDVPHLRQKWGAKVWTLDRTADKLEHPERYDYCAMIQSYGLGIDSVPVDRAFKDGETFEWEGYRFTVDWMPGQTEFALCLHGRIDGKLVAFTGDNLFGNPRDAKQNGHEAVVARNSAVPDEGYVYAAGYLSRLKPDLLMGGHSWVMDEPADLIERYRKWSLEMRDALAALSSADDYRYWFDPYWVRAEPYRVRLKRGGASADVRVHVRNFRRARQAHCIEVHVPPGLTAEPAVLGGTLEGESRASLPVRVRASADAEPGVKIVALDATLDGRRYGEWFDFVVEVE